MEIVSKKNFIIFLAAVLVIAFGYMALTLSSRPSVKKMLTKTDREIMEIQKQSTSDEIEDIEKDLIDTDLIDVDRELQDIEGELEAIY